MTDVDKIRKLIEAATGGPWISGNFGHVENGPYVNVFTMDTGPVFGDCHERDADLVVFMRNKLPGILDELDKLREEVKWRRAIVDVSTGR